MMESKIYTKLQLITLVALRVIIGWHLLYEGVSKLFTPGWSSVGFLKESQWIMSGVAKWIISHGSVLAIVDFLNVWGLIAIGLGLILGLFTRIAAISGAVLVLIYYFNNAPIIGIEYSVRAEGSNLIVSKTLIEAVALLVLTVFPTGSLVGLDVLMTRFKNIKKNSKWLKKKI
jgi:thiosulfate dehydrogenase (quinone) large subunit